MLTSKNKKLLEDSIIYYTKQQNHYTAEIVKVKRIISMLGDNEHIIAHLASLEHMRDYYNNSIHKCIELLS